GAVSLESPGSSPVTVQLQNSGGHLRLPASITIPAGASSATFSIAGLTPGVEEVSAIPGDPALETAVARVQVAGGSDLKLAVVSLIRDVVSAASFDTGIAAGAFQALRGLRLSGGQSAAADYPWPPSLAGVKVTLNGSALPILYVSDSQINFYVPQDAAQGEGV